MDYPPNASIPVYNEHTVYVKALRIPKGINVQFKNDVYSKREPVKTTGTVQNNKNLMFMEDEQKPKDENKQSLPTMTNTQKEAKKENAPVNPPSSTNSTNQTNNDLFDIFNTKGNNAQPVSPEANQQMPKIDSTCNNISILFL